MEKNRNEGLSEQTAPLDDPDEMIFRRMEQGLEPDLTFDEAVYFRMEHNIKELEKKRRSKKG